MKTVSMQLPETVFSVKMVKMVLKMVPGTCLAPMLPWHRCC